MKIIHVILIGINGGENIIQKYINYIKTFKLLEVDYNLVVLCPLSTSFKKFENEKNIVFLSTKTVSPKCIAKRIWLRKRKSLDRLLIRSEYDFLFLRIDFMDKNLLGFINLFNPILEYPTPPIEDTLIEKEIYYKLANRYNKEALHKSFFNITSIDVGYYNSYILNNSLVDNHVKKESFDILDNQINALFMSSRYDNKSNINANGYDRFLKGLEVYLERNSTYNFTLFFAGNDIDGCRELLKNYVFDRNRVKIVFLGFVTISELNKIIEKIDIGINDLAFHRKKLYTANALKTIDFIGWGLPFILSHNDVNLNKNDNYYYTVPSNDSMININDIIDFLSNIKIDVKNEMQIQAKNISLEERLKSLLCYLEKKYV